MIERDWGKTQEMSTALSYDNFLRKYPNSIYQIPASVFMEQTVDDSNINQLRKKIRAKQKDENKKNPSYNHYYVLDYIETDNESYAVFKDNDRKYYKVTSKEKTIYLSGQDVPYLKYIKPFEGIALFISEKDVLADNISDIVIKTYHEITNAADVSQYKSKLHVLPTEKKTTYSNLSALILGEIKSFKYYLEQFNKGSIEEKIKAIKAFGLFSEKSTISILHKVAKDENIKIKKEAINALKKVDTFYYEKAKKKNTIDSYKNYLNEFINAEHKSSALEKIEEFHKEERKHNVAFSPNNNILESYPDGIEGTFKWKDGTEKIIIFRDDVHFSKLKGKDHRIPWSKITKIVVNKQIDDKDYTSARYNEYSHTVYTNDGKVVELIGRIDQEGNWNGLKVHAINWDSAVFITGHTYNSLDWGSSWCVSAGGCTSSLSWGAWNFVSKSKQTLSGIISGGFSFSMGESPGNVAHNKDYEDKYFTINMSPFFAFSKLDFSKLANASKIEVDFINGYKSEVALKSSKKKVSLNSGYFVWTYIGKYQVQSIIRVKDLTSMKLIPANNFKETKSHVSNIKRNKIKWTIHLKNGKQVIGSTIKGIQAQPVPKLPPNGYVWRIYPDLVPGEVSGEYIIVKHSSGFHIIPLYAVKRINLSTMTVQLKKDAGGLKTKFSRFHPGTRWIATVPDIFAKDMDADKKLPRDAKIWIEVLSGKTKKKINAKEILYIEQLGILTI